MDNHSVLIKRWQALPGDQRRLLLIAFVVVFLMLYWALFWDPLFDARRDLRQQVGRLKSEVIWVQQLQPSTGHSIQGLPDGKTLLRLIDETLRAQGMAAGIERIEPSQTGSVRVALRGVAFDRFSSWLTDLTQTYSIGTEQLSVQQNTSERETGSGLVDVRIQLLEG